MESGNFAGQNLYRYMKQLHGYVVGMLLLVCISTTAQTNNALLFNGTSSVVKVPNFTAPAGDFSIEAWAKITGGSGTRDIVSTHENPGTRKGYFIEYAYGDGIKAGIAASNNAWVTAQYSAANWQVNQWHHVVMTYNAAGKTIRLYQDGVQVATATFSSTQTAAFSTRPFAIGGSDYYTGNYFPGGIDEVYFWDRELSSREVDTAAHLSRAAGVAGLRAWYPLNDANSTIADASGHGWNGTPTGLTTSSVVASYAPVEFTPVAGYIDYKANWPVRNNAASAGVTITSSYTAETDYILFAHSVDSGVVTVNLPSGIQGRLKRVWHIGKSNGNAVTDSVKFNLVSNKILAGTTGKMYLLVSDDATVFSTFSADTGKVNNSVVSFAIPDNLGKYFTLGFSEVPSEDKPLIAAGGNWKYLDNGTDQGTAWQDAAFNDAAWAAGNAELGYGDGDEATTVSYGTNASNKYVTTYFRKTVNINSLNGFNAVKLRLLCDDGAVVYVNGIEAYRYNMPAGAVGYNTYAAAAIDGTAETTYQEALLSKNLFASGNNTIAVEVHQANATSSDISFNLELLKDTTHYTLNLLRGPYLQAATTNSIVIRWRTDIASSSKVAVGTSAAALTQVVSDGNSTTEHIVKITGLTPYTKYYYSIGTLTDVLQGDASNYFSTLPVAGTADKLLRIGVIGDCGNNSTNQRDVRDQLASYLGSNYMNAWILLGDNAYTTGADAEFQAEFFNIYKDGFLKQNPLFPAPGNHDYGNDPASVSVTDHSKAPYYQNFTMPVAGESGGVASNNPSFYSFDIGNIHFLSLDSYGKENNATRLYDTLGAQVQWIKQDLEQNRNKGWIVAYWHHPPYTMGSHNSDGEDELVKIRQNFIRILERYGVDLILCGHSHCYERSKLMKGYYGDEASFNASVYQLSNSSGLYDGSTNSCPYIKDSTTGYQGTLYVVSGSAGQLGGQQGTWPHNAMHFSDATHGGSMILEVKNNRLDAKWIGSDGIIRDQFTIMKDVNKKTTYTTSVGNPVALTASYNGVYNWQGTKGNTSTVSVSPTQTTIYVVKDSYSCVKDSFVVNVTNPMLPFSFDYVRATVNSNTSNLVTWQGLNELYASMYQVERSEDGIGFVIAGQVNAIASSNDARAYSFTDNSIDNKVAVCYYRIKEVGKDGSYVYSSTVKVERKVINTDGTLKVAPNPAYNNNMTIYLNTDRPVSARIVVTDVEGSVVTSKQLILSNTPQRFLPPMRPGIYTLHVQYGDQRATRKLIIR